MRITLNGDKATIYFECHYIDPKTAKVVCECRRRPHVAEDQRQVADHELGRIDRNAQRRKAMAQLEVLEAPPDRDGGRRSGMRQPARPARRAHAGDSAHEAARRVPRDHRVARPRQRARPAGPRPGERARRAARHAPAPVGRLPALEAHAHDLQQTARRPRGGRLRRSPATPGRRTSGGRAVDARRPGGSRHAVAGRARDDRGTVQASSRRRPTNGATADPTRLPGDRPRAGTHPTLDAGESRGYEARP